MTPPTWPRVHINRAARSSWCTYYMHLPAHTYAPLSRRISPTKHKIIDKIIKNFNSRALNQAGDLCDHGVLCNCTGHTTRKQPCVLCCYFLPDDSISKLQSSKNESCYNKVNTPDFSTPWGQKQMTSSSQVLFQTSIITGTRCRYICLHTRNKELFLFADIYNRFAIDWAIKYSNLSRKQVI